MLFFDNSFMGAQYLSVIAIAPIIVKIMLNIPCDIDSFNYHIYVLEYQHT